jgi:hypothetical protein
MFSFFIRNRAKIETALRVIAFIFTVIIEAVKTISAYVATQKAQPESEPVAA